MIDSMKAEDARAAEQKRIRERDKKEAHKAYKLDPYDEEEEEEEDDDLDLDDRLTPNSDEPSEMDGSDPMEDGDGETPAMKKDPKPLPDAA